LEGLTVELKRRVVLARVKLRAGGTVVKICGPHRLETNRTKKPVTFKKNPEII
jgi:hypothetical protein